MSVPSQLVVLPEELIEKAAQQANHLGVSTEQWIEVALSERIRLEQETAEFFSDRAARVSGRTLGEILDRARDRPPDPGDGFED